MRWQLTELELRVGYDYSALGCDGSASLVDMARQSLQLTCRLLTNDFGGSSDSDVFVMALVGFGGRAEDRGIETVRLAKPRAQWLAGESAMRAIFLPRRPRQVA